MSLSVSPGASFEAAVSDTNTGLTGTIGVQVVDGAGAVSIARHTTNIVETPSGSGVYVATMTAPSTAGTYWIVWDTGGSSPTYSEPEDLTVAGVVALGQDLISLTQVRSFLQKATADTAQDSEISAEITRASLAIMRYTEREFRTATSGSTTRTFECELGLLGGIVDMAPFDLRGNPTTVAIDTDQSTPYTLSTQEWRVGPMPASDGVYPLLRIRPQSRSFGSIMWPQVQVQVTGTWGFATVPADVQMACLVTVATWLRREVQTFSRVLNIDQATVERPRVLPEAAMGMLSPYKRCAIS